MLENKEKNRVLIVGEVLFDCFSDGRKVLGGAPFNVAWHLKGMGLDPFFASRVGDDDPGREILFQMEKWGLDRTGMQEDGTRPTGRVDVIERGNGHTFDIVRDCAYDCMDAAAVLNTMPPQPALLYHGSLAFRFEHNRNVLRQLRDACDAPVFCDINLREPWWEPEHTAQLLRAASYVKLNDEELDILSDDAVDTTADLDAKAARFCERYDLQWLIVTRGAGGALLVDREHGICRHDLSPNSTPPVDTVGAGDAFTAVVIRGLTEGVFGAPLLAAASTLASRICSIRGATTFDWSLYKGVLNNE